MSINRETPCFGAAAGDPSPLYAQPFCTPSRATLMPPLFLQGSFGAAKRVLTETVALPDDAKAIDTLP